MLEPAAADDPGATVEDHRRRFWRLLVLELQSCLNAQLGTIGMRQQVAVKVTKIEYSDQAGFRATFTSRDLDFVPIDVGHYLAIRDADAASADAWDHFGRVVEVGGGGTEFSAILPTGMMSGLSLRRA